ncbi:hypothetical protein BKA70DRAFT_1260817 [Coprinopsis sp. MPI-PUGE-AT-0042]|nr:hypothetical protein BKA70DRAFT_1260817 [Coprinopsis sp. MPI-PUGE-AT-0042]
MRISMQRLLLVLQLVALVAAGGGGGGRSGAIGGKGGSRAGGAGSSDPTVIKTSSGGQTVCKLPSGEIVKCPPKLNKDQIASIVVGGTFGGIIVALALFSCIRRMCTKRRREQERRDAEAQTQDAFSAFNNIIGPGRHSYKPLHSTTEQTH